MPTPLVTTRPRMKRVRHRSEPERYGSGIELARGRGSDRRVLVKWDNGLQQFHDKGEILPEGTIMKITKRQLRRIIKETMTMDLEMEIRNTAINILKGGGDREEVSYTLHEIFPEAYEYIDMIIADAEEMIEFGVR